LINWLSISLVIRFFQPSNCNLKQMSLKSRVATNKHCKMLTVAVTGLCGGEKFFSLIKKRNNFLFLLDCTRYRYFQLRTDSMSQASIIVIAGLLSMCENNYPDIEVIN
jgi:hypothetical protein